MSIAGVIVGAIIVAAFALSSFADAGGYFTAPAISATKASIITVGPDTNIQISASSSRAYMLIQRETPIASVYCNANGDRIASTTVAGGVSFKLSTSTGESYEFELDRNGYDGAVRCTATASTSITVFELKRN